MCCRGRHTSFILYYLLIYLIIPFFSASVKWIWKKGCRFLLRQPFCSHNFWSESDSQALTALRTAAGDDLAAILGSHAVQETVDAAALTLLGLESTLHFSFLLLKSRYGLFAQGFAHTLGQPCRVRLYAIRPPFVKGFLLEFFAPASKNCRYRKLSTTFCTIYCWKSHFLWKTFR